MSLSKHPTGLYRVINRIRRTNLQLNSKLCPDSVDRGTNVMSKDWDNLIILDTCRLDYFKDLCPFQGNLNSIMSKGNNTREFVRRNFRNEDHYDTVLVFGNAHYRRELDSQVFFYSEMVNPNGNSVEARKKAHYDGQIERTIQLHDRYPDKRMISHFNPPHTPYRSDEALQIRQELAENHDIAFKTQKPDLFKKRINSSSEPWYKYAVDLHRARKIGLSNDESIRYLYKKDLKTIMSKLDSLIDNLNGKTVITADHGELLGDRLPPLFMKHWTHPTGVCSNKLRRVPWFIIRSEDRRKINKEQPISQDKISKEEIEENLEALGYL